MIIIEEGQGQTLSDLLIDVLVCPKDHHDLKLVDATLECVECGTRFPIEDGIPNMLVDQT